jgi:glucose/arabinose dehydrogenase
MRKRWLVGLAVVILVGAYFFRDRLISSFFRPTGDSATTGLSNGQAVEDAVNGNGQAARQIEVVAENLKIPWEITFLADESLLVTERPGNLVRIYPDRRASVPVNGVAHVGEGGLLGLALHPQYEQNHYVYLYLTTREGGTLNNRVERYVFNEADNQLSDRTVIVEGIPGAANHDGGRLVFGPDRLLYITTGDAQVEDNAQDSDSLSGKILRLKDDGIVPEDNPFNNATFSLGHRNPEGLAWDSLGRLWSSEHGPSGGETGNDEINLIQAGANYGWPVIRGTQTRMGMVTPVIESGRGTTWAPADILVVDDLVFFTGLRGETLYTARIIGQSLTDLRSHFAGEYGRLRAVVISPDGQWIYLTTSNTDGRGTTQSGDDKIIRFKKDLFFQ